MANVIDLLSRPVYGLSQVDALLSLRPSTARRWIDGYARAGRSYPPVVREVSTGDDTVTWGGPQEVQRFREAGLRVFWIAGKKDMSTWGWLTRLVRQWPVIERIIIESGEGPWFYAVNEQSVREMKL